jgi:hypothetical protein
MPEPIERASPSLGAARTWLLLAAPVATAVLLGLHPTDPADPFELRGQTTRWLTVHVGLLITLPLLAITIRTLLAGLGGVAASVGRLAVVPMAAFYAAFDALLGIGTGILVIQTDRLAGAEQAGAEALTRAWWAVPAPIPVISVLAIASWMVALGAAALAHRRAGSPIAAVAGFGVAAVVFGLGGHPGITGVIGMAGIVVAVVVLATRGPIPSRSDRRSPT